MQYVGQTCRKLKNRFGEHYRKIKKPKKFITGRSKAVVLMWSPLDVLVSEFR